MPECLNCHGEKPAYEFQVIEIQTLHIRDIKGERYVQAMGDVKEYGICASCAQKYLAEAGSPVAGSWKKMIPFGILILAGLAASVLVRAQELFIRLIGPIAVICGIIGIIVTLKEAMDKKKKFQQMKTADALQEAAWNLLLEKAPKKNEDQDITYVPVDKYTRGMNVKQLTLKYDLLPAIAAQVVKKIKEIR